uniref:Uncharacterized protein n=1 Tax=Anguilla anguilla TaxID=7936 RepID=A0A0E9SQA5_ANGAN
MLLIIHFWQALYACLVYPFECNSIN